jgi:GNAT superfamily N-acetyltransferase
MLIRHAHVTDSEGIARVHVESWRSTYRGIVPEQHLAALSYDEGAERWRGPLADPAPGTCRFVAEDEHGEIVGFATGGPRREGDTRYAGELYAIYLLPERQRTGTGRALIRAVAAELWRHGMRSMIVWVLAENPARGFYQALGGQPAGQIEIEIGGTPLAEVAYGWDDLTSLVAPEPEE